MRVSWLVSSVDDEADTSSSILEKICSDAIFWLACRQLRSVMVLSCSPPVWGQNRPTGAVEVLEGNQIFVARCGGCHGADARGSDRGPALAEVRRLRSRSVQQLRDIIQKGIPGTGMPPFDLPAPELDALAALVRSLNGPAAESVVSGDVAAGEQYFFGRGQCASCHMVLGKGRPIGPDLSNVGSDLTAGQIREALLQPGARIAQGYELVTVRLRDGQSLRGFARSRSSFDVRLQDLEGKFHLLQEGQVLAIQDDAQSLMPPLKASPEELQGLMAYLSRLTGVKPGVSLVAPRHAAGGTGVFKNPKSQGWRVADLQRQAEREPL